MKRLFLGVASVFLFSCGGGGGGTQSSNPSISLYFTDDASMYPSILVKVYEVNLCSDNQCQQKVNLFSSQGGLEVDLAKLSGVLEYITTTGIPQGTYNRLEVVMDKNLTITDNSQQTHQAVFVNWDSNNPNKPNTVQCPSDRCYIRFNGIVQPFSTGKLVVDFVLKDFDVNTSTNPWQVTQVKMMPLTPQDMQGKIYDNKLYVSVLNVSGNSFTGTWMGKTYTINLTSNTVCEINDVNYFASACVGKIGTGMCVEVKVLEDPSVSTTLTAIKVETENPAKCMMTPSTMPQPPMHPFKLKGIVVNKDSSTFTLNTYSSPIGVTENTYCEYQKPTYMTGYACLTNLQTGWFVEVKMSNNQAIKIERED